MSSSYRMALCVCYEGTRYAGWQIQHHLPTVQAALEAALSRVADHPVTTLCAGRTDAGVHATGQVVHFDTTAFRPEYAWVLGANSHLPPDMSVTWAKTVEAHFHARYSALSRRYQYFILNQKIRPSILRQSVTWVTRPLDTEAMQAGAAYLLGEHDFSAFRGAGCQSHSPRRHIFSLTVTRRSHSLMVVEVWGNAFLQHMVRNIVGVLIEIGNGQRPPEWAKTVLEGRDRKQAAVTMPPTGLYLVDVEYPAQFDLPESCKDPFFLTR